MRSTPALPAWTRTLLFLTATTIPFILASPMYAMWFRASRVLGHTPRASLDDPRNICPNDTVYQWLLLADNELTLFTGTVSLVSVAAVLLIVAWTGGLRRLSERDCLCFVATFLISLFHVLCSDVHTWWLD